MQKLSPFVNTVRNIKSSSKKPASPKVDYLDSISESTNLEFAVKTCDSSILRDFAYRDTIPTPPRGPRNQNLSSDISPARSSAASGLFYTTLVSAAASFSSRVPEGRFLLVLFGRFSETTDRSWPQETEGFTRTSYQSYRKTSCCPSYQKPL